MISTFYITGKQVFRRRQQELEKLTVEQIERSRKELSDLERRFLERVAQTNRTRTTPKEGRVGGYGDDDGLAPWMTQPDDGDSSSQPKSSSGSNVMIQPRVQPQTYANGFNGFNGLDSAHASYGISSHAFPGSASAVDNGRVDLQSAPRHGELVSSVLSAPKDISNGQVKIKSGKLTSSLYGGSSNPLLLSKEAMLLSGGGGGGRFDGSYDPTAPSEITTKYGESYIRSQQQQQQRQQQFQTSNQPTNLLFTRGPTPGQSLPAEPAQSSIDRTSSLEMLCSLDMVKFPQNHSTDSMAMGQQATHAPFPWYNSYNASSADMHQEALGNGHGYYDSSLKNSASAISLTDFAMSLWPSMNNLATAAEALSSSSNAIDTEYGNLSPAKPKYGASGGVGNGYAGSGVDPERSLGSSLSKLQSLSNVALDELEVLASLEEEKNKASKAGGAKAESTASSAGMVGSGAGRGGSHFEPFDVGYSLDDSAAPVKIKTEGPSFNEVCKSF